MTVSVSGPSLGLAVLAALLSAAILVEPLRRFGLRHNLTDRPAPHKAHLRPTPYLGGIAILTGTLVPLAVAGRHADHRLWLLLAGAALVAIVGLVDDVRPMSPRSRLAIETLAAIAAVLAGARLTLTGIGWVDPAVAVIWIVVLTNSYNLMDNSDGALATVAGASALPLSFAAFVAGRWDVALLMVCLTAGSIGFLLHNWPPARIFMGDAGSLFVGFSLASGVLIAYPVRDGVTEAATLLLVAYVTVLDTALVMTSRLIRGQSWWQGGTDHVTHRLRRRGLGQGAVLGTLLLSTSGGGLAAAMVAHGGIAPLGALIGAAGLLAALVTLLLLLPDRSGTARSPARPRAPRVEHTHSISRG